MASRDVLSLSSWIPRGLETKVECWGRQGMRWEIAIPVVLPAFPRFSDVKLRQWLLALGPGRKAAAGWWGRGMSRRNNINLSIYWGREYGNENETQEIFLETESERNRIIIAVSLCFTDNLSWYRASHGAARPRAITCTQLPSLISDRTICFSYFYSRSHRKSRLLIYSVDKETRCSAVASLKKRAHRRLNSPDILFVVLFSHKGISFTFL